ncbi:MAG: 6-bladed beta-propeller [Acidobacteriota bacterium]|nr:6-bladed beta-propeller [Acidobacteriota bacterium]
MNSHVLVSPARRVGRGKPVFDVKNAAILAILLAASSTALSAQTWKGTIVKDGDVTVVRNPKTPLYPAGTLQLKEELAIGGESLPAEAAFSVVRDLEVAPDGRIYIADVKQDRIFVFDANGRFLTAFGKRGQGPGEFLSPMQMSLWNKKSELFVDGMRKGVVFGLDGTYKENIQYPIDMLMVKAAESGALAGTVMRYASTEDYYQLVKTREGNAPPLILAKAPIPNPQKYDPFMPRIAWTWRGDGTIVEGYPERYEIKIHNADGKVVRILSRDYDPVAVPAREKEKVLKAMAADFKPDFSNDYPAFQYFVSDENGRLFVLTWEKASDGKGNKTDVFDSAGRFLLKLDNLGRVYRAVGGKLYCVDEDEEGYQVMKRYALVWEKLKPCP